MINDQDRRHPTNCRHALREVVFHKGLLWWKCSVCGLFLEEISSLLAALYPPDEGVELV